jgi:hypothetical protein
MTNARKPDARADVLRSEYAKNAAARKRALVDLREALETDDEISEVVEAAVRGAMSSVHDRDSKTSCVPVTDSTPPEVKTLRAKVALVISIISALGGLIAAASQALK